jgi:hypothetical protein
MDSTTKKTTMTENEVDETVSTTVTTSLETGAAGASESKKETVTAAEETTLAPCELSLRFLDDQVISDASEIL